MALLASMAPSTPLQAAQRSHRRPSGWEPARAQGETCHQVERRLHRLHTPPAHHITGPLAREYLGNIMYDHSQDQDGLSVTLRRRVLKLPVLSRMAAVVDERGLREEEEE
ncbi:hypothetical protein GQ53DRAFT_847360 [Thozetella sp. PMI_491]|nr:hypothetical protein GQ53DRAFT_847360 [Thozetella sp. PMI_491]